MYRAQEAGNINVFPAHTHAFATWNWMDGGVLHRRNFVANEPPELRRIPYSVFHVFANALSGFALYRNSNSAYGIAVVLALM